MGKDVKKLKAKGGGKVITPVLSFLLDAPQRISRKTYFRCTPTPRGIFSLC